MLILRSKQIEAIAAPMRREFESEMVCHVKTAFPEQCESMDDDALLEVVRYGMGRARRYSLTSDGQIKRWLGLMFTFGREFDTDPTCRWTQNALQRGSHVPNKKMNQLYSDALKRENKGRGLYAQRQQGKK